MNQNINFDVALQDVYLKDGTQIEGKKAIQRVDTGNIYAIVSDNYQPVKHTAVLDAFAALGSRVNLKTNNISASVDGGVMFAIYDIANKKPVDIAVGDLVKFQLRVFNSYDLSMGIGFELYAQRLICLNGMVVPLKMSRLSYKHFESFNIDTMTREVLTVVDGTEQFANMWRGWTQKPVSPEKRASFIKELSEQNVLGVKDAEKLSHRLMRFNVKNLWDVFNVFTEYTTHEAGNRGDKVISRFNKESKVMSRFYNYQWNGDIK